MINIFTDGSTINNGKKNAIGGIGVYIPELNYKLSLPFLNDIPTNQKCELLAISKALEYIFLEKINKKINCDNVNIYSDSEYSINVCTKWINLWKKKKWKTTTGKEVKNLCFIKNIDIILNLLKKNNIKIYFYHVKSHQIEPRKKTKQYFIWQGNFIADKLSKMGKNYLIK